MPEGGKYKGGKYLRIKSSLVELGAKRKEAIRKNKHNYYNLFYYFSLFNFKIIRSHDNFKTD